MSPKDKSFFAGLEEVFARLLGLALTLVFFLIYIVAIQELLLGWLETLALLSLFWFIYEIISLLLFSVFRFFAKQQSESKEQAQDKAEARIENDYQLTEQDSSESNNQPQP